MATINYSVEANVAAGYVKVEWTGLSGGDNGQAFDCAGLKIGSVQAQGTFNGNTLFVQGSNEVSPANFTNITNFGSDEMRTLEANNEAASVGSLRPLFTGSGGSVKMAIVLLTK